MGPLRPFLLLDKALLSEMIKLLAHCVKHKLSCLDFTKKLHKGKRAELGKNLMASFAGFWKDASKQSLVFNGKRNRMEVSCTKLFVFTKPLNSIPFHSASWLIWLAVLPGSALLQVRFGI